jgi:hypothetical protein
MDDRNVETPCDVGAGRTYVRTRQQRSNTQIAKVTLPFIGDEGRVKRHADGAASDRDHRYGVVWSFRQHYCHPAIGTNTKAAQSASQGIHL